MEYNSYVYIAVFLPTVAILFYFFKKQSLLITTILIFASAIFYGYYTYWYFFPLVASSILDYHASQKIDGTDNERTRKRWLLISIFLNLGLMCFFKYTAWITGLLHDWQFLVSLGIVVPFLAIPLPPGISFYTFQTMSYTIDVYRREIKPEKNFLYYTNFVAFFPQLVAGPIERAGALMPQLVNIGKSVIASETISTAFFMILWGLFLKICIADNIGGVTEWLEARHTLGWEAAPQYGLLFGYSFAFQLYCDFMAYTTIARGSALLIGVDLSQNFKTPYLSSNASEFWERWHITLSSWFRDYVYFPLGGNRSGAVRTILNLLITMFLSGLWHGAGILFILWGLWHGLLLIFYQITKFDQLLIRAFGRAGKVLAIFIFFHLVVFGWILFRATPDNIGYFLGSFLDLRWYHFWPGSPEFFFNAPRATGLMATAVFVYMLPVWITDIMAYRKNVEFVDLYRQWPNWIRFLAIMVCLYGIFFFGSRHENEFVYFRF